MSYSRVRLEPELAARRPTHRLFIDEVGDHSMKNVDRWENRFLSLTGVATSLEEIETIISPAMDGMKKQVFGSDEVGLHRYDIVHRKGPFAVLRDHWRGKYFDSTLLSILEMADYAVITVTIDKLSHMETYKEWQEPPYHYCMMLLVERFVKWLETREVSGDVMAEARGKIQDRNLSRVFTNVWTNGTFYLKPEALHASITSQELKLANKASLHVGLELADLIAFPSFAGMRHARFKRDAPGDFATHILKILTDSKYHRSDSGRVDGYGRKWLPK